ncbi:MAG: cobalamin-binding protein, partial [Actinomycetales bacterium]
DRRQSGRVQDRGQLLDAVDEAGAWARPGTRLVDGVEELAAILHPA